MGNSVRIVQVDDGSFVLEVMYKDAGDSMGVCKHKTITAESECAVMAQLDKMFRSGFPFKKTDAFDLVFTEEPPVTIISMSDEATTEKGEEAREAEEVRPVKSVEDTPIEQMVAHMAERHKNQRMRD